MVLLLECSAKKLSRNKHSKPKKITKSAAILDTSPLFQQAEERLTKKIDVKVAEFEKKLFSLESRVARSTTKNGKGAILRGLRQAAKKGMKTRRNAVIGLAAGAAYAGPIKTFVASLRKTGYKGEIVLGIIEAVRKELASFIKANDVTTVIVKSHKCRNPAMGDNCGDISHGGEAAINLARFQMYKDWTANYAEDDLIMVTDVRDVYFQADPFPLLEPELAKGKDWFGFEEEIDAFHNTLGWHSEINGLKDWNFNRGWIWGCWGKPEVDKLKEKIVLCSGTTIATHKGMTRYLDVMLTEIEARIKLTDKDKVVCTGTHIHGGNVGGHIQDMW
jgi:hypothetical protein